MTTRKRILITGAAGCIGRDIAQRLSGRYNLVLSDIKRPNNLLGCLYFEIDITDLDAMRSACRDIDTVLHLAADPSIEATWESLLTNNIIGAYNVFQAAHEAGCRRVVFASSAFAVLGYPPEIEVHTGMPVCPSNLYGASKAWGEAGFVKRHDNAGILPDAPMLDMFVTYRDLAKLIVASIEAPDGLRFGIFHGLSDNRHKRLDISNARSELGYEPEDDAYELADMNARLF
jgi:nucleoside-diphosphate-sugar epimerase